MPACSLQRGAGTNRTSPTIYSTIISSWHLHGRGLTHATRSPSVPVSGSSHARIGIHVGRGADRASCSQNAGARAQRKKEGKRGPAAAAAYSRVSWDHGSCRSVESQCCSREMNQSTSWPANALFRHRYVICFPSYLPLGADVGNPWQTEQKQQRSCELCRLCLTRSCNLSMAVEKSRLTTSTHAPARARREKRFSKKRQAPGAEAR